MHLPPGMQALALASGVAAALGTVWLFVAGRRLTGALRQAYRLVVLGAGGFTATVLVALVAVVTLVGEGERYEAQRALLGTGVAVGGAVSGLVLAWGLLRLPAPGRPTPTLRHLLDCLAVGAALWFTGWVLVVEPTRLLGPATPATPGGLLLSLATLAAIGGVTVVSTLQVTGAGDDGPVLSGVGALVVGFAATGVAVGAGSAGSGLVSASAAVLPVGLLLLCLGAARAGRRGVDAATAPVRRGSGYVFLPMVVIAAAGLYHTLRGGVFSPLAVLVGCLEGFVLVARQYVALLDVRRYADQLANREAHYRNLAHTDPLTGLANRRALLRELYDWVADARPGRLIALDLDGFKTVNDMQGHDVGDAVLIEVGRRLAAEVGGVGVAARLGGDEFAVLLPVADAEAAHRLGARLLAVLNEPYPHDKGPIYVSASIGMACRSTAPDVPTLLRNADLALRAAKQRGKNRVEQYDVSYDQAQRRRTLLEHEMRGAIDRDELRLAFQPVVAVPSVRPVGAEALIRWHHPELGRVPPDEFIPLAEECGMINRLGAWVLDEACRQLARWLAEGHDVWVSVNVSPHELHAPAYVLQVDEALRRHRVPPQRLVLEVTEHAVARDLAELIRRLTALRATGVRIALDDFGAGYSSLGQLRNLPIDILKIDHSLVAEQGRPVAPPPGRRAFAPMVDVVMRLGHQLGLEVIAEGVTNQAELAVVVDAGCRFGQGALFGWGVPAEHLEAMLAAATSVGGRRREVPSSRTESGSVGRSATSSQPTGVGPTPSAQDVRSVDSSREMRQA
ncbi:MULTISPECIES: putative bifunctional diguanylate cyclase/phosphodiesterase [unclassified Solwaraspora]|uniref:putative bifunctional diguanylate cyclase/phosphodiesterase n=1 Tax=unclassified Solwaraspora TaxID=2627926 RepID=UPI00259B826A|nr:bifunctional diguanylate cyclase/phosphodiesterase [Solwaraspora sp. WMMA2056]WJK40091.1 bifunctional diguanylate cyclase/phosphodiesterase [Solwaraspora sp. WMMA2056]